jgi:hypothetical protein
LQGPCRGCPQADGASARAQTDHRAARFGARRSGVVELGHRPAAKLATLALRSGM